jgi:hypothetical protein
LSASVYFRYAVNGAHFKQKRAGSKEKEKNLSPRLLSKAAQNMLARLTCVCRLTSLNLMSPKRRKDGRSRAGGENPHVEPFR